MKRSLLIAIAMVIALFIYGYAASNMGHVHDKHGAKHNRSDDSHHH